jgi:multiple sugar transport system substrate-binding protein
MGYDDRLVDVSDAIGHFSDLFDPDVLSWEMRLNARTGQRALYGLPMGRTTYYVHVWKSLLEQAGFTLEDVPREWNAFSAFWCDDVQPAVRRAMCRDDIWGGGLSMGAGVDTGNGFFQFLAADGAEYVTRDGRLVINDAGIRRKLIETIDRYTAFYRKGCTPPDAVNWATGDRNNKAFLAKTVVMRENESLSIPNPLKSERPDDYYKDAATIEWPLGPSGAAFPIVGTVLPAVVFKDGDQVAAAEEFVCFLVAEGWLAHYLNFSGERMLPPMQKLLDAPFWLDPSDPHRMAGVMQVASRPLQYDYTQASSDWRHDRVSGEFVWAKRSTASRPTASAPSRRSTRRSPGSSRSSPNRRVVADRRGRPARRYPSGSISSSPATGGWPRPRRDRISRALLGSPRAARSSNQRRLRSTASFSATATLMSWLIVVWSSAATLRNSSIREGCRRSA